MDLKHQMSQYFEQAFNSDRPTLPLSQLVILFVGIQLILIWDKGLPKNDKAKYT